MEKIQRHTFANGLTLVHKRVKSEVAHLALMVNVGTTCEPAGEDGLAHFIEHVIFKGTEKRRVHQVLGRLENVGSDLNAYTNKEETCIHASFLKKYYTRALELFADIIFHSTYPEKEIEKEKEVVIDEINAYRDNPAELILDDFEKQLFVGHPLAKPVLGTAASVKKLNRQKIRAFTGRHYVPSNIVVSSVGNIGFERLIDVVEHFFGVYAGASGDCREMPLVGYQPFDMTVRQPVYQTHCVIGTQTYGYGHPNRVAAAMITNLLGGPAMNSRLSMALREKSGISYNIEAIYTPYSAAGSFMIYLGIANGSLQKASEIIRKELDRLMEKPLGTMQYHLMKQQFIGQLALSMQSHLNEAIANAKSMLIYGRVDTYEEILRKINEVSAEQIRGIANDMFAPDRMSRYIMQRKP